MDFVFEQGSVAAIESISETVHVPVSLKMALEHKETERNQLKGNELKGSTT